MMVASALDARRAATDLHEGSFTLIVIMNSNGRSLRSGIVRRVVPLLLTQKISHIARGNMIPG